MQYSDHYQLNLVQGTDTVNPLIIDRPNYEAIDDAMWDNKVASVGGAVETKTGTVHAITRTNSNIPVFRFTATANIVAGDTFTVDGDAVTAVTPSGGSIAPGAYVIGSDVIGIVRDTRLTLMVADEGIDPSNYATKAELQVTDGKADAAQTAATAAGVVANQAATDVDALETTVNGMFSGITTIAYVQSLPSNPSATTLYLIPET